MNKFAGRWIRTFLLGVVIGLAALILQKQFFPQMTQKQFMKIYFIAAPIIIFGTLAINIVYARKKYKKLDELMPLSKTDPKKYIEEAEKQLQIIKSPYVQEIIKVNIGAAYSNMENYKKSKEMLEAVDEKKLGAHNFVVYKIDLAYIYFNLGEMELGKQAMDSTPIKMLALAKSLELKILIKINEIYCKIAEGNIEEAREYYSQHKELLLRDEQRKDINKLEKLLGLA